MGFEFLNNYGEKLGDTGIYIAGIPDINAAEWFKKPVKAENALYKAEKEDYVIMLSHTPKLAEGVTAENVDLQLSGHTHGGQLFALTEVVAILNATFVRGWYALKRAKLYVHSGSGVWNGFPVRVGVPSEIAVFTLAGKPSRPTKDNI